MTPSEETCSSAIPSPYVLSPRLRVEEIARVGPWWRLAYEHCDHVHEFAGEGLLHPGRLLLFVQRNFPECLTCRMKKTDALGKVSRSTPDDNALGADVMGQPLERT
jgi:hypothetical protein